ncbi:diaminopimelate epimerase [Serinibacter arcticus]|uniref:Diaminopimelate epimerase n=1 Tax=Serinibacter arcticus TaxID=1655435 RepID=A0A4Z1E1R5_9MICO|nr:diaminopimelate epimerase [Serinibacter arcticus]TGO05885.1 Diaminopimelate epimerase [Serinibacter arcticus]
MSTPTPRTTDRAEQPTARTVAHDGWPRLVKGHGTGNDFLLCADPDGGLEILPADVAAITDRHRGIGADGLIRAVRIDVAALTEPSAAAAVRDASGQDVGWFMDYRNADGSVAEMCGNGLRVFVAFLVDAGLASVADGEHLDVATRAGVLRVHRVGDDLMAEIGRWDVPGGTEALTAGSDALVTVAGVTGQRPGLSVSMPNPHVVIAVADERELAAADLTRAPLVEPAPPHGTNVEIVWAQGEVERDGTRWGVVSMRVHERGVGETLSCGTGACAAALAAQVWAGPDAPVDWIVHVPGGTLVVHLGPDRAVALRGPAQLVGDVTLR